MNPIMSLLTERNGAWASLLAAGLSLPMGGCEPIEQPAESPAREEDKPRKPRVVPVKTSPMAHEVAPAGIGAPEA